MANTRPLLIIGDAISGSTGLSRIARDLSVRIYEHLGDVYRLGTAGHGTGSRQFDFPQYNLEAHDWVCLNLPEIVEDFAGRDHCTIFFIWDASRLGWFSQPDRVGAESLAAYPGLAQWLKTANIEKWIYCPIDASGPCDKLTFPLAITLLGFNRILAYGQFGEDVIRRTIGDEESKKRHLTFLPHGIDSEVFYEHNRHVSRAMFLQYTGAQSALQTLKVPGLTTTPIAEDECLIGIVATNQSRKNFPLALETCARLASTRKIRVWIHTDALERNYSIPSLLIDYSLIDKALISLGQIPDQNLAAAYSACSLTIGPGAEGYGFPAAESLACQTPVITGSYAGAADFVPKEMQVDPIGFYNEGSYGCMRPVYRSEDWAKKAEEWIGKRTQLDSAYFWENNWKAWGKYLREAAK